MLWGTPCWAFSIPLVAKFVTSVAKLVGKLRRYIFADLKRNCSICCLIFWETLFWFLFSPKRVSGEIGGEADQPEFVGLLSSSLVAVRLLVSSGFRCFPCLPYGCRSVCVWWLPAHTQRLLGQASPVFESPGGGSKSQAPDIRCLTFGPPCGPTPGPGNRCRPSGCPGKPATVSGLPVAVPKAKHRISGA